MNDNERLELAEYIGGLWVSSQVQIAGKVRWFDEMGVGFADARATVTAAATESDRLPSVKLLSVKLAERGQTTHEPLGVGDPAVIARMKTRIMDGPDGRGGGVREICERTHQSFGERLRDEQAQARQNLDEAVRFDLGGVDYHQDMLRAYDDLIAEYV